MSHRIASIRCAGLPYAPWLTPAGYLPIYHFWTPKTFPLASDRRWAPDIYTPQPLQMPLPSPSSFWQLIAGVLVLPIISYQGKQACLSRIFAARVSSYQIRQSSPSYSGNEAGMNEPELGRYGIIWLDLTCLILDFTLITGCNCCDSVRGPRLNGLSGYGQKVATNLQLEFQCLASRERIGEQRCRDIYLYSTSTQPPGISSWLTTPSSQVLVSVSLGE